MSVESDVRTYVLNDSTVSSNLGTRWFPRVAPQNPSTPYLVLNLISTTRDRDLSGPGGFAMRRYQMDIYDTTADGANDVADAIRQRLDGAHVVQGSTTIKWVELQNEQALFEEGTELYRAVMDFMVAHNET